MDWALKHMVLTTQAVVFGLMALLVVPWQIADGLGYPWLRAILSLWWLVSTALLAIFLTPRMGIQGMAYSRLLPMTVTPVFILIVERIAFGRCLWEFWRRIGFALILAGSLTALTLLATRYLDDAEQKWLKSFMVRVVVSAW